MKITMSLSDLLVKSQGAPRLEDVEAVRALTTRPEAVFVKKNIYVWVAGDTTPDDGDASLGAWAKGRYRRPAVATRGE